MRGLCRHAITVAPYALVLVAGLCVHSSFEFVSVAGGSMRPALRPGDLVVVRREDLPVSGDIALIELPGRTPYVHRVSRILKDGKLRMRGDANPTPDAQSVDIRHAQGTVKAVVPFGTMLDAWREGPEGATLSAQSNISKR